MLEGGCFCGFVRYEVRGNPMQETCCHCGICRRTSGAPFVAWFTVPAADLRVVRGDPARFRSSDHAERSFCPRCGTPLTFRSDHAADEVDVTTASLDAPERVPPKDHTFVASRVGWMRRVGDLPEFPGARPQNPSREGAGSERHRRRSSARERSRDGF